MTDKETATLDLESFRSRIGDDGDEPFWRNLEERSRTEEYVSAMHEEFPRHAAALDSSVDRRDFVKLMGASLALAGMTGCRRPDHSIIPYVKTPENFVPGQAMFFATAMTLRGVASGLLVESHEGRPTKIEGNPDHPSSLGATDAFAQASILGLYDPDRSQTVRRVGEISTWSDLISALQPRLKALEATGGAGLRILTGSVTSPTFGAQLKELIARYPKAVWHQWEPDSADNVREGSRIALGSYANTVYHFDRANLVVALDADFLSCGTGSLRYARDFMSRRRIRQGTTTMNRLYVIEPSPTGTGAVADHRLPVRATDVEGFARAIAAGLGVGTGTWTGKHAAWVAAVVKDLKSNAGSSVVIAGDEQPPAVHALAHQINAALGNAGRTVMYTEPLEIAPVDQLASLRQLVTDVNAGAVQMLVMIGGNPVFDAPADFAFGSAIATIPLRIHLSPYYDETSLLAHWHIPETHFLEMWSDARGHDGTVSIIQPLIAPLYNGKSPHEVISLLTGGLDTSGYDLVRNHWKSVSGAADFEKFWQKALNDGIIAGSALPAKAAGASGAIPQTPRVAKGGLEILFRPDPTIYDGRFANNGWLQELPKPSTKITWDNVALVSPRTAKRLRLGLTDAMVNEKKTFLVTLSYNGRKMNVPVWMVPGHADDSITIHYGYGRSRAGRVGTGKGFNSYQLRTSDALHFGSGAEISPTTEGFAVACTQEHQNIQEHNSRRIVRTASLASFVKHPDFAADHVADPSHPDTLREPYAYPGHAWGMSIDTTVCTGCNGCVLACQAENNIPVVGKLQVLAEREMHWLRIDRYYRGNPENPEVFHEPVPCMHCENAPCEPVCPVEATSHSEEGLNDMTYNRCIGTRYCSNNCPYKVRRFNFFQYSDYDTPSLKGHRNPHVSVRTRGVMEKCTYCVQRITEAKIEAEKENRLVRDGAIVTACQAACPTEAIVFGNINDPGSRVAKLKKEPHNFGLLAELNTRPRTTYLATIRNPNPELLTE